MSYLDRAWSNIASLSTSDNVKDALKEWETTDRMKDHEEPTERCQLCDHPNCRYHYEIQNVNTGAKIWTGSECILRFMDAGMVVTDESGTILEADDAKKHFRKKEKQMRRDTFVRQLRRCADADAGKWPETLRSIANYFESHDAVSPNQMKLILWRADETGVKIDAAAAKISLRRDKHKLQLEQMEDWQYKRIRPYLSSSQRKKYDKERRYDG